MANTNDNEIRAAREAVDWFMRLDDGEVDEVERLRYARWLKKSRIHAEAIQFIQRLSLHLKRNRLSRDPWRPH